MSGERDMRDHWTREVLLRLEAMLKQLVQMNRSNDRADRRENPEAQQ